MTRGQTVIAAHQAGHLYDWMRRFPAATVDRLRNVNSSTGSAKHVVLALSYGLYDKNIAAINRTIVRLLLNRMFAERSGDELKIKRIQSVLAGLHLAIDWVTGAAEPYSDVPYDLQTACRSPGKPQMGVG